MGRSSRLLGFFAALLSLGYLSLRAAAAPPADKPAAGPPTHADKRSGELLTRYLELAASGEVLMADVSVTFDIDKNASLTGTARLMRPNYGTVTLKRQGANWSRTVASDGRSLFVLLDRRRYFTQSLTSDTRAGYHSALHGLDVAIRAGGSGVNPLTGFLSAELVREVESAVYTGPKAIKGRDYESVTVTRTLEQRFEAGKALPREVEKSVLYFGPTGFLEGSEVVGSPGEPVDSIWIRKAKVSPAAKPDEFAAPPRGFQELPGMLGAGWPTWFTDIR